MQRQDAVLAVLAAADGSSYSPAQLQKALFLIDRNLPDLIDGPAKFEFRPYDYAFDRQV